MAQIDKTNPVAGRAQQPAGRAAAPILMRLAALRAKCRTCLRRQIDSSSSSPSPPANDICAWASLVGFSFSWLLQPPPPPPPIKLSLGLTVSSQPALVAARCECRTTMRPNKQQRPPLSAAAPRQFFGASRATSLSAAPLYLSIHSPAGWLADLLPRNSQLELITIRAEAHHDDDRKRANESIVQGEQSKQFIGLPMDEANEEDH